MQGWVLPWLKQPAVTWTVLVFNPIMPKETQTAGLSKEAALPYLAKPLRTSIEPSRSIFPSTSSSDATNNSPNAEPSADQNHLPRRNRPMPNKLSLALPILRTLHVSPPFDLEPIFPLKIQDPPPCPLPFENTLIWGLSPKQPGCSTFQRYRQGSLPCVGCEASWWTRTSSPVMFHER